MNLLLPLDRNYTIWSLDNIPRDMIRTDLPRMSKCEIEIDARCKGASPMAFCLRKKFKTYPNSRYPQLEGFTIAFTAHQQARKISCGPMGGIMSYLVPSFFALITTWQEDRLRRNMQGKSSQASPVQTPEREDVVHFPMAEDAHRMFAHIINHDKISEILPSSSNTSEKG